MNLNLMILIIIINKITTSQLFATKKANCIIDVSEWYPLQPLILESNSFFYPNTNRTITIKAGKSIQLSCPGSNINLGTEGYPNSTVTAYCASDNNFIIGNEYVYFEDIVCSKKPYHNARFTKKICGSHGNEIEIRFNGTASEIIVCFDEQQKTTFYSQHNITRFIAGKQSSVPRPFFIQGEFFEGIDLQKVYSEQRRTINSLVGLSSQSTKYVKTSGDFYLARGHLAPKADFVYGHEQRATFYYVNAAPQWQTFNGGNWEKVESNLRKLIRKKNESLVIYTGTYGISSLPHEANGKPVELFLYVDENNNKAVPVPKFFWKVVYNPETKAGIALVGINNPYAKPEEGFCHDVSKEITWLKWKPNNITRGLSFACDVNDFKRIVTYLPYFEIDSLLK